ncbi:uncharacterized protein LOC124280512 isoform X2 [Haliotis rubra]|uniref:uncharacterized protein LOC124280512 isoform X2 n=1 Tax=Haliotis rubra TaxID=36100 RepID=UPI001EE6138A|nr:uncharacterized protein LOC124280512 isoform X2 [Haliotis rubra]
MSYILIRWTIVAQVVAAHKAKLDCGSPTPLSGMVVPVLPVNTSLGSTCHYVCADGFTLIRGSGNSSCEADGDWSTPSLQCSEECGKAVPAPNTYLQTENGGQTLRYSCFYSYILLSGDLTRRCEKGHLTGQAPACQLDCGSPLTSNRTASFVSPYTTAGSTVKYTCPNGRANAESTSLCDPEIGSWDAEDKCYGKLASTDIQGITQSSLAFQHDVITSSNATNSSTTDSDKALYGAGNAIDTVYGVYLGQGHCSSTAAEHKPYVIITLTDMMAVYRVVVTLPNDTYAYSLDKFRVHVSQRSLGGDWMTCYRSNRRLGPGTTVSSTCQRVVFGRRIKLFSEFPHHTKGMLQLCDVHVYGDLPLVDCGKPTSLFRMEVQEPPVSTLLGSVCNYTCADGFTWIGGSGHSVCQQYGDWSKPSLLCTDEVNYAYNTIAWMVTSNTATGIVASNITDTDRSTCHVITQATNVTTTVDLQRLVEARDISLVIPDASSAGVRLTVSMSLDKEAKKICMEWSPGEDALEVIHLDCLQHPVGQYLLIKASFLAPRDFRLCDVWVGGRIFDKPYECVTESGYKGSVNVTVMGIPCQRWDAQSPHTHTSADARLPDYSLTEAANRCRSTTDRPAPWCYTTDPSVRSVLPGGQL